jgi:hypothetical protein
MLGCDVFVRFELAGNGFGGVPTCSRRQHANHHKVNPIPEGACPAICPALVAVYDAARGRLIAARLRPVAP